MIDVLEMILTRRTIRRFKSNKKISLIALKNMVRLGALAPSRVNRQPLKFAIVNDKSTSKKIFSHIFWGIKNPTNKIFADPKLSPNSYIALLVDRKISESGFEYEVGASAENIMLYAWSLGIGSVWVHSCDKKQIGEILKLPESMVIDSIIGLGYPAQKSKVVYGEVKSVYEIDKNMDLTVTKRRLKEILFIKNVKRNK